MPALNLTRHAQMSHSRDLRRFIVYYHINRTGLMCSKRQADGIEIRLVLRKHTDCQAITDCR